MNKKLYNIKTVRAHDTVSIDAVAAAEQRIFNDPWSTRSLADACSDNTYSITLASFDGEIAGYLISSAVADESELLRIAVLPEYRRFGIATALASHYLKEAARCGIVRFFLEVRRSNEAARALYENLGYRDCGVRRAYYREPVEDAILMMREEHPCCENNQIQEDIS